MVVTLTLAFVTSLSPAAAAPATISVPGVQPRITVWTDRDEDPYRRGDRVRVYFTADRDAYVTVIRVDTDGHVRVLFPVEPWEDNFARGGTTFEVLGRASTPAFRIDDAPGVGYIFAVSSLDPFDFREISLRDRWDYRVITDGRVEGDPYVALTDLASRIAYDYDYDIVSYYVERRYDYPRFVCYDCHAYATYYRWDPYRTYCTSFRIVIYDDPYYYPYRRYGGRNVVILRPRRPGPRYVFKDADRTRDYITRVSRRPNDRDRSRARDRDRTSVDVGGRGRVPAPVGPRSRRPGRDDDARAGARPRRGDDARARPVVPSTRPAPEARDTRRRVTVPRQEPGAKAETPQPERTDRSRRRVTPPDGPDRVSDPGPARRSPRRAEQRDKAPSDDGRAARDRGRRGVESSPPPTRRAEPQRRSVEAPSRAGRRVTPRRGAEPKRAEPKRAPPRKSTGKPELKRRRKS